MKHSIKAIKLVITAAICCSSSGGFASPITLDQLPELIRHHNKSVKAGQVYSEGMRQRTNYLVQSFLPNVTASAGTELSTKSPLLGKAYRLETYINVYNGLRDQIEESARQSALALADADLRREYSQNLFAARRIFWSIIAAQDLMAILEKAASTNKDYQTAARRRIAGGIATKSDLIQFQLYDSTLSQEQKRLLLDIDIAKSQLAVLLGIDDHVTMQVKGQFGHPSHQSEHTQKMAVATNPELAYLHHRTEFLRLDADKLATSLRPQVEVYSDFGQPTDINRDGSGASNQQQWFLGLRLKMDLADSVTDQRESAARREQSRAAQLRAEQQSAQIQATHHEITQELPLRHELIHDSTQNIAQAEEFLKLVSSEYNRGVKNATELLAAAEQLMNMKRRAIDQLRDYYVTESQLAYLVGN